MPPVIHPFFLVTENENRSAGRILSVNLKRRTIPNRFEQFEKQIKGCKVFILCNPHNPGGRVWNMEELKRIASICAQNNVLVFSDEIHADLTFRHINIYLLLQYQKKPQIIRWFSCHPVKHSIWQDSPVHSA